jgi:hypothetical protein
MPAATRGTRPPPGRPISWLRAQTAFNQQHPGVAEFLSEATWSPFAQELAGKLAKYGSLTGHKEPIYRAAGLVISRASDYGKDRE